MVSTCPLNPFFPGLLTSGVALVALGFTKAQEVPQAVALLVLAVGSHAACMSGWSVNHIDLCPHFAGTIMGLTNGFAHISAIIAPLVVQLFVIDQVKILPTQSAISVRLFCRLIQSSGEWSFSQLQR